jgi:fructan beta-fructosidase
MEKTGHLHNMMNDINPEYKGNFRKPFRPKIHFAPQKGWMNDPNGLIYYNKEYHLFYQHIPDRTDHNGSLHWGHAKSKDLFNWEHLPIALRPDQNGDIWSGCIIVDNMNSSKLQSGIQKVLVAIFTQNNKDVQEQSLAFSNDCGMSWTLYPDNPILSNPGLKDFRDPKVFWHPESSHWIMVVAAGHCVQIYKSQNLLEWDLMSEFGKGEGCQKGIWECPDLFKLNVDGQKSLKKWVMLVSLLDGSPTNGPGVQYFIGEFDGQCFMNDNPPEIALWLDYGYDYYAATTFSNFPNSDRRQISIAWMNNWKYAQIIPTKNWRGMMTIPREFSLKYIDDRIRLFSIPVFERRKLINKMIKIENQKISSSKKLCLVKNKINTPYELKINLKNNTATEFGIIFKNDLSECVILKYNYNESCLTIDRNKSGLTDFNSDFAKKENSAPLVISNKELSINIIVDVSSIEVFAENGQIVLTNLVFPTKPYDNIYVYTMDGEIQITQCSISEFSQLM